MKQNIKGFLSWFFLILWMGIIFYLSSQPDLKSGFESWLDFVLRKAAHMTEFAVLTFFAWRAFANHLEFKFSSRKLLVCAVFFSILYAISDEYHQTFVTGRTGSLIDVAIDSAGVIAAALLVWREKAKE